MDVVFPERVTLEVEDASVILPESAILVEVERFLESVTLEERFLESVRLVVFPEFATLVVEEASEKFPESDILEEEEVERFLESVRVVEVFPEFEVLVERFLESVRVVEVFPEFATLLVDVVTLLESVRVVEVFPESTILVLLVEADVVFPALEIFVEAVEEAVLPEFETVVVVFAAETEVLFDVADALTLVELSETFQVLKRPF